MQSNIENIYRDLLQEINSKQIVLEEINVSSFFVDSNKLNNLLLLIFKFLSSSAYSFSIFRKNYGECEITLFDKQSSNKKEFTLIYIKQEQTLTYAIKSKLYNLKFNILKAIKIVPIIGPDGVGKTTLFVEARKEIKYKVVYKKIKKVVRRSIIYNIFYPINRAILSKKLGQKPQKDQHDESYPKLIILAGLLYYPYLVFVSLFRKKVIFFDRFFQDYLFENLSFPQKQTKIRDNWKNILKFIPLTFWHIQLDAKSEIIVGRKDELTIDDIDKFREYNFLIYLEKPAIVYSYINTGNDLENCKNIFLNSAKEIGVLK